MPLVVAFDEVNPCEAQFVSGCETIEINDMLLPFVDVICIVMPFIQSGYPSLTKS